MNKIPTGVVGGVDTHKSLHVAAVVDAVGRLLGSQSFPATTSGFEVMLRWMQGFGCLDRVGIEGTGSYGASLSEFLRRHEVKTIEVNRPNRQLRRQRGKTDFIDAELAARAALNGEADATPKDRSRIVGSIRALRVALTSTRDSRTRVANQMHSIVIAGPEVLRSSLLELTAEERAHVCARFRPGVLCDSTQGTKAALKTLGIQYEQLSSHLDWLRQQIDDLVIQANVALVSASGVGVDVASILLVAAGDNPERLKSESAFAALCGVSPVNASSGKRTRRRLNRGGNRQANHALWRIVLVRLSNDEATRSYMKRRIAEGKSRREVVRCLKRYVAREIFTLLTNPPAVHRGGELRQLRTDMKLSIKDAADGVGVTRQKLLAVEHERQFDATFSARYFDWLNSKQVLANL
jgi:transposase